MMNKAMRIKKGDTVTIIAGKDRGKTGKVIKSIPSSGRLLIEGINLFKKHVRPKRKGEKGEVVSVPKPVTVSNAALLCANCKKTTRVGYRNEGAAKRRYCKRCLSFI